VSAHPKTIALAALLALVGIAAFAAVGRGGGGADTPRLHPHAFDWLRPGSVPGSWSARLLPASPARLPVPPGWRSARSDPGTRTVISRGPSGEIAGYLNATPRQGEESLANWGSFRVDHNREEGDRDVELLAAASGLRFATGRGSCVLDSYRTESDARYRELACIVAGRAATTVIVAAAPPRRWRAEAPTLRRAIATFTT
jgi:hypothetical protein